MHNGVARPYANPDSSALSPITLARTLHTSIPYHEIFPPAPQHLHSALASITPALPSPPLTRQDGKETCNQASNAHDWTDCWPPRASSMPDPGVFMGWGIYSPGVVCPAGFTTAAMATYGGSTGWSIVYPLSSGETAAACCPTGFSCSGIETLNTYGQTCVLTVTSAAFSTVQCNSGSYNDFSLLSFPRTISGKVQSSFVLFAPLIQINFQASDLPKTTSSGSQPTSSGAAPGSGSGGSPTASATQGFSSFPVNPSYVPPAAGSPGSGTAPSSSSPDSSSSSSSGLPLGAKVGIGVGVGVGAILLGFALLLLYRAWQRRRQTKVIAEGEAARDKMWPMPPQPELGGQEVQELEGSQPYGAAGPSPVKRKPPPGPVFKVASPSLARGSLPEPGPVYELDADTTPTGTTPITGTPPRARTPVIFSAPPATTPPRASVEHVSPSTPTAPRFSRDFVSPTTPTGPRISRELPRPVTPQAPLSRELRPDDI